METTLPPLPLPIIDGRRDFMETYKNELIAIGVLSGLLVVIVIYLVYRRFTAPPTQVITPQVKKQQQKIPPLKNVNNKRIRANLPAINNPISTGFSNQFHEK